MDSFDIEFAAEVWVYGGQASWYFVSLPPEIAKEIKILCVDLRRGWGSIPVTVRVGKTSWTTSVFPDGKRGTYILPIKAEIRKKENISAGDTLNCTLQINIL